MSSSSNARTGSSYDATVAHLRRVLGGFAPDYGDAQRSEQEYVLKVPPSKLPVAVLAREVMVVFGAADLGAEDKVAWCYGFTVDGVPCTLASTKWGLRLHLDVDRGALASGQADSRSRFVGEPWFRRPNLAASRRQADRLIAPPAVGCDGAGFSRVDVLDCDCDVGKGSAGSVRHDAGKAHARLGPRRERPH